MPKKTFKAQSAVAQGDGTAKLEDGQIVTLINREQFGKGDLGMVEHINGNWLFMLKVKMKATTVSPEAPEAPRKPIEFRSKMQTLHCKAGHDWTRPPARGRKPEYCPEHEPAETLLPGNVEPQVLQCKAGHEWTRPPARGRQPEWCPEHRPQPEPPAEAVTEAPKPTQVTTKTVGQPVEGDEENGPIVVVQPKLTVDQIIAQYQPDNESVRKLNYIDRELTRGRASKDAAGLLKTREMLLARLQRMARSHRGVTA